MNRISLINFRKTALCLSSLCIWFAFAVSAQGNHPAANAGDNAAQVRVWQETLPDKTIYRYSVVNLEPGSLITSVWVGYDYWHGIPLLSPRLPAGARICSPRGWAGKVVFVEETLAYYIEWRTRGKKYDIKGGQELRGFAVEVPIANNTLRDTQFKVSFGLGKNLVASTHITSDASPISGRVMPTTNCIDPYAIKKSGDQDDDDHDKSEKEDTPRNASH